MSKSPLAVLMVLALLVGADDLAIAAANTPAFYVGTCKPAKADFTTIQAAVSAVPPGSTINVCPGVYQEQVTITRPLTLQGVQTGNNAQVVITTPAGTSLGATVPVAIPVVALVAVSNSGGAVDISGVTIDGEGIVVSDTGVPVTGILYNSTPGTLDRVLVQNFAPFNADAVGITFRDDLAASPINVVQNSTVSFPLARNANRITGVSADTGIVLNDFSNSGGTITLSITNDYVSGAGLGIDIRDSVAATVTGNVVNGATTNGTTQGEGADVAATSGPVKINNNSILNVNLGVVLLGQLGTASTTVSNNTIVSSVKGMSVTPGGSITINGNQLISPANAPSGSAGFDFACATSLPTVAGNTVIGATVGLANVPAGLSLQKNAGTFINVPIVEQLCE
jgi:hypothetical protein